ncbi:MAG: LysR family transcriptional regulator [Kofleriaceae bacterium]
MQLQFDWNDARIALAMWREGKVEPVALKLRVDPTTVVRRLDALEQSLKVRLFDRSRHGWRLTAEGEKQLPALLQLEAAAFALGEQLTSARDGLSGWVRLTTAEAIGHDIVAPGMVPLLAAHPMLRLSLLTDRRVLDLERYEADLALRSTRPRRGTLTATMVGSLGYGLYRPKATGSDAAKDSTIQRSVVITGTMDLSLPEERWLLEQGVAIDARLRCPSFAAQVAAAEAGLGMALLPCFLADNRPGLTRCFRSLQLQSPLWLVRRAGGKSSPAVRAVANHLVRLLSSQSVRLSGVRP